MNYKKIYDNIINNRLKRTISNSYYENHHIIPRSLGGNDSKNNIIGLTAREHFICHYLLAKMYIKYTNEWYKSNYAFFMMKCGSLTNGRYFNSRLYDKLKTNFAEVMSKRAILFNTGSIWISNMQLRINKKIRKNENIPDGWIKGRNVWNIEISKQKQIETQKIRYLLLKKNRPKINKEVLSKILSEAGKKRAAKDPSTVSKNTIWINDGISLDKRINKTDIVPINWYKGRLKGNFHPKSL